MGSRLVVRVHPGTHHPPGVVSVFELAQAYRLVLKGPTQAFYEDVVHEPTASSIDIRAPDDRTRCVNARLVNWDPWSVLKIPGVPVRIESSSAPRQKPTSMVFESRHDSTRLVAQSITATR